MNNREIKKFVKVVSANIFDKNFRSLPTFSRPGFLFWGPSGSGKTTTVIHAANEMNVPIVTILFSQENPEDMSFPEVDKKIGGEKGLGKILAEVFPRYLTNDKGEQIYRREVKNNEIIETDEPAINFEALKGYISNYDQIKTFYENQGLTINDAPGGIYFMDEITRITDKGLFQMLFQLLSEGRFKGYRLPESIAIFSATNPSKGYITANWFDDEAFSSRCVHFISELDHKVWDKEIASKNDYDPVLRQMVETDPTSLYDPDANNFEIPTPVRNFRSMALMQQYVLNIDWTGNEDLQRQLVIALLGIDYLPLFEESFQKVKLTNFGLKEILNSYDEYDVGNNPVNKDNEISENHTLQNAIYKQEAKSPLRKMFLESINGDEERIDYIDRIKDNVIADFVKLLKGNEDELKKLFNKSGHLRFIRFVLDLPKGEIIPFLRPLIKLNEDVNPEITKKANNIIFGKTQENLCGTYFREIILFINKENKMKIEQHNQMKRAN